MPRDNSLNRPVAALQVHELVELIRKAVHDELAGFLRDESADELVAAPPTTRDIDTVIARIKPRASTTKSSSPHCAKVWNVRRAFNARKPRPTHEDLAAASGLQNAPKG